MSRCNSPLTFYRPDWGQFANAADDLGYGDDFHCVAIAPDSEADSVELRIGGEDGPSRRVIVSRNAPYFGRVPGKATQVFPTLSLPLPRFGASAVYDHRCKLLLYKTAPPWVSTRRAPLRFDLTLGDGANGLETFTVDKNFPYLPVMGRDTVFIAASIYILADPGNVDLIIKGGRAAGSMVGGGDPSQRVVDRFGAAYKTHDWGVSGATNEYENIQWTTLSTESGISTIGANEFSYQYAGDFDFIAVECARNQGGFSAQLRLVAKDN
jgi:hypothetical protein